MKKIVLLFSFFAALTLQAQNTEQLLRKGDSLVSFGNNAEAYKVFETVLKKDPGNAGAMARKSAILLDSAKFDAGMKLLEDALKKDPKNSEALTVKARTHMLAGRMADAKKLLDDVISRDPKYTRALVTRAILNQQSGSKISALLDYDAAVKSDTNDLSARLLRARYHTQSNYLAGAIADYTKAISIAPKMDDIWFERGMCYVRYENWEKAIADMNKCIEINPKNFDAVETRGTIYLRQEKFSEALTDYQLVEKNDSSILLFQNMAMTYYSLENPDKSCEYWQLSRKLAMKKSDRDAVADADIQLEDLCDSAFPSYYYQRGIANFNLGKFDESVKWHNRGLARFPGNTAILQFRGNSYLGMLNLDAALADYNAALADRKKLMADYRVNIRFRTLPENDPVFQMLEPTLRMLRAEVFCAQGKYDDALRAADEALMTVPSSMKEISAIDGYCKVTRAHALSGLGRNAEAVSAMNNVVATYPSDPHFMTMRAMFLLYGAYSQKDKSASLKISFKNGELEQLFDFPLKPKKLSASQDLKAAEDDLTKAIGLDPSIGKAWYMRGLLRCQLGNNTGCDDLKKAKELGYEKADAAIAEWCK